VFVGNSGHHEIPLNVSTIVATKTRAKAVSVPLSFVKGVPGSWWGAIGIHIPSSDLFLLWCHSACLEWYISPQIRELDIFFSNIQKKYKHIIYAGDFNRDKKYYLQHSKFARQMNMVEFGSTFPSFFCIYKAFVNLHRNIIAGQIDHIFYTNSLVCHASQILSKRSDHRAVFADLWTRD
jgi:endonuclease/exonuclease/phosphatase (EEP) superfamily protein YafD